MKVKLSNEEISKILSDPVKAKDAGVKVSDPWWVIVLKVLAYAIGLLLAGGCTGVGLDQIGIIQSAKAGALGESAVNIVEAASN